MLPRYLLLAASIRVFSIDILFLRDVIDNGIYAVFDHSISLGACVTFACHVILPCNAAHLYIYSTILWHRPCG